MLAALVLTACIDVTATPPPEETPPDATEAPQTAVPASETPMPTASETAQPAPTDTPELATPEPSATPTPTLTPEPGPTATATATTDPLAWTPTPIGSALLTPAATPLGGVPVLVLGEYRVLTASLNVRMAPSTSAQVLYGLRQGDSGLVFDVHEAGADLWLCISPVTPCSQWIAARYGGATLASFGEAGGGGEEAPPLPGEGER